MSMALPPPLRVRVEGWHSTTHSFSIIHTFLLLELSRLSCLNTSVAHAPYHALHVRRVNSLYPQSVEQELARIPNATLSVPWVAQRCGPGHAGHDRGRRGSGSEQGAEAGFAAAAAEAAAAATATAASTATSTGATDATAPTHTAHIARTAHTAPTVGTAAGTAAGGGVHYIDDGSSGKAEDEEQCPDAILRNTFPFDLRPDARCPHARLVVMAVSEFLSTSPTTHFLCPGRAAVSDVASGAVSDATNGPDASGVADNAGNLLPPPRTSAQHHYQHQHVGGAPVRRKRKRKRKRRAHQQPLDTHHHFDAEHSDVHSEQTHNATFSSSSSSSSSSSCTSGAAPPSSERCSIQRVAELTDTATRRGVTVLAPTVWAKRGLAVGGVQPASIHVIPHGVDTSIFFPLPTRGARDALRAKLGWTGNFVFLCVGAMTKNKGVVHLLRAFERLMRPMRGDHGDHGDAGVGAGSGLGLEQGGGGGGGGGSEGGRGQQKRPGRGQRCPRCRLVLKGNDEMYDSNRYVAAALASLEAKGLGHTVRYLGGTFNFSDMAALYQASDALVSPYRAEGFNLPVLEAVATGLPVIVSRGGPTDEFTTPQFARYVRSRLVDATAGAAGAAGVAGERRYHVDNGAKAVDLEPDEDDLLRHLQNVSRSTRWRERARVAGPLHVRRAGYTWKGIARAVAEVLSPRGCGGESEGGGRGGEGEETPTGGRDGGERETA